MVFKNEAQLKKYILDKCKVAIAEAEKEIYQIIDLHLNQFYNEFEPEEYIRTRQLFHSLVRSGVKSTGNGYVAEVYFDASKLNYEQGVMPLKHTPEHGRYGWATWDGNKVLDVAMTSGKPHGGYASGTAIWNESMAKIGDIGLLLVQKLEANGIPIR